MVSLAVRAVGMGSVVVALLSGRPLTSMLLSVFGMDQHEADGSGGLKLNVKGRALGEMVAAHMCASVVVGVQRYIISNIEELRLVDEGGLSVDSVCSDPFASWEGCDDIYSTNPRRAEAESYVLKGVESDGLRSS